MEEASRSLSKAKDLKDTLTTSRFCLPRQNICRDKTFLSTKRLCAQNLLCAKNKNKQTHKQKLYCGKNVLWSRQKMCIVAKKVRLSRTKLCLPRQIFVATKVLLPEKYVCRNKSFFRNKPSFVATKVVFFVVFFVLFCLFGQILVATKDILVAAPTNDR